MRILMVLTSHDQLGNTGKKTGMWLEEFTAPYYVFKDAGAQITLASPKGGQPPLDPKSDDPGSETASIKRFRQDKEAQQALADTMVLAAVEENVASQEFDAIFYPGGHGPLWDLSEDRDSITLIEMMYGAGKPVGAVCHGPAAFRHAKLHNGRSLVEGKRVTGFSNSEEQAVQLTEVVPFLVEDSLKKCGGIYSKGPDWASYVQVDGMLVTGQNPASSEEAARAMLKLLKQ